VYIAEAHATDIWPLGNHVTLPSHQSIEDRTNAANLLVSKFNCKIPILMDKMEDTFDRAYAVWPERYYVIQQGIMEHVFYPTTEFGFDHQNMLRVLNVFAKRSSPEGSTSC